MEEDTFGDIRNEAWLRKRIPYQFRHLQGGLEANSSQITYKGTCHEASLIDRSRLPLFASHRPDRSLPGQHHRDHAKRPRRTYAKDLVCA